MLKCEKQNTRKWKEAEVLILILHKSQLQQNIWKEKAPKIKQKFFKTKELEQMKRKTRVKREKYNIKSTQEGNQKRKAVVSLLHWGIWLVILDIW